MYSTTIQVKLAPPSFFMGGKRNIDYADLEINEMTHSDEELRDTDELLGGYDSVFNDGHDSFDALFTDEPNFSACNNFDGLFNGGRDEMAELDHVLNNEVTDTDVHEIDLSDISMDNIY